MKFLYDICWPARAPQHVFLTSPIKKQSGEMYEEWSFRMSEEVVIEDELIAKKRRDGIFADLLFGDGDTIFVNNRFVECLREVGETQFQLIPCQIVPDGKWYYVLNILRVVDCVDREKSRYQLWLPEDNRPDKLGKFRGFDEMVLDSGKVPQEASIFFVKDWEVALIVTQRLVDAFNKRGITGFTLNKVTGCK